MASVDGDSSTDIVDLPIDYYGWVGGNSELA